MPAEPESKPLWMRQLDAFTDACKGCEHPEHPELWRIGWLRSLLADLALVDWAEVHGIEDHSAMGEALRESLELCRGLTRALSLEQEAVPVPATNGDTSTGEEMPF